MKVSSMPMTVTRIILLIVIGILLAFMLIYNIATGVYKDHLSVIMSYMVITGAIVLTLLHGIALIKKLTNKNK
jgi:protein-S-isoprenylcysteine O-methyltransferase Ste14